MAKKQHKDQIDMFEQHEEEKVANSFTGEQKEYIFYDGKKSIILSATAGSGKTFCCVHRLKELLKRGVDPKKIVFFSFTNAAVDELKERVNNPDIRITTIHSFCFWMLHRMGKFKKVTNFYEFIEWYRGENKPKYTASEKEKFEFEKLISNLYDDADFYDSSISSYKLQMADGIKSKLPDYYIQYSKFLKEERKRDFSDILIDVRNLLKENKWLNMFKGKFDYVFLDEYQDTSAIQMEILMRLNAKYYYLVGDRNQSIYGYSGSNCDHIEGLLERRRKTERMTLTTNFRSASNIVQNSNKFSSLEAVPFHEFDGDIIEDFIDFDRLVELIKNEDEVAVLARTNFVVKLIEFNLLKKRVPMKYFNYLKPKDIEDYKNGKLNPLIRKRMELVLDDFVGTADDLVEFIEENKENDSFVTTIHKSKGKEYHTCVVVNSVSEELIEKNELTLSKDQKEYYSFFPGMENYQEEKNIHYVSVSRPKHKLYYMLLQVK
jgi:DNA helicase-2/ATP-dependent DNA helicase PcrA